MLAGLTAKVLAGVAAASILTTAGAVYLWRSAASDVVELQQSLDTATAVNTQNSKTISQLREENARKEEIILDLNASQEDIERERDALGRRLEEVLLNDEDAQDWGDQRLPAGVARLFASANSDAVRASEPNPALGADADELP